MHVIKFGTVLIFSEKTEVNPLSVFFGSVKPHHPIEINYSTASVFGDSVFDSTTPVRIGLS